MVESLAASDRMVESLTASDRATKSAFTAVLGRPAELPFDAQELVVLRHALRARGRARLDLTTVCRDGKISDKGVLGLAGSMRDHGPVRG
jgi:hypothetical protein